jgi:hypothetical protein
MPKEPSVIGRSVARVEGAEKVSGHALYGATFCFHTPCGGKTFGARIPTLGSSI